MGGVSIVFPFVILQGAISTAVGGGAASIVSRKLGRSKYDEAGEITLNAMLIFYISAVIITVLGFLLMNPVLRAMGVTDALYPYAKQYFTILLAGNIFSTGFSSIIRAEGKMLYGMLIWVIPISINIVLDAVFILVLGWGVKGAALATLISQFISFSMSAFFFARMTSLQFKHAKLKRKHVWDILGVGLPSLVQVGSLSVISMLLNRVLGSVGGTLGITAFAYISKIISALVIPFTAVTQALAPIMGYNYGAGNFNRVKKTMRFCTLISFIYAIFIFILTQSIPQTLMGAFTDDHNIITLGANGLRIIALAFFFMPLPMLLGASYQAMGQKAYALILYAANMVFLIPCAYFMSKNMGVTGVWWAYVIANICATLLTFVFWKAKSLSKNQLLF